MLISLVPRPSTSKHFSYGYKIGSGYEINQVYLLLSECEGCWGPFLWSRVPETTFPRVILAGLTFRLLL